MDQTQPGHKEVSYGGFWIRLMAHNIDLMVLLPVFYLQGFLIESNKLLYVICLLTALIYEIAFTASKWSCTPGKRYLKLKVVDDNYNPMGTFKAIARTLIKFVTLSTLIFGYAVIAFHPKKSGLHDLIVKSHVILKSEA